MKTTFLTLILSLIGLGVIAQGQPHAKIFSNFNYDLSADDNAFKAFEVKRAYLGYGYKIDDNFSAKVTFDVGNNDAGSAYTAFLKIASISWKASEKATINFGQIGSKNFKFMEKTWGYRYIYKSFQDQQKWANSADAGISADYKVNNRLTLDGQILNGEGFKKTQSGNGLFRSTAGLTFKATEKITLRLSQDLVPRENYSPENKHQNISSAALAYFGDNYRFGLEYHILENHKNISEQNSTGVSTYLSYKLKNGLTAFGRYDEMASENDWNISNDGTFTLFGIEKQMTKGVKASINYQSYTGAEQNSQEQNTFYINLEYKF